MVEFDPETCEYIIADFDPMIAAAVEQEEHREQEGAETSQADGTAGAKPPRGGDAKPRI